jgi:PAS domain S-box-containing protein
VSTLDLRTVFAVYAVTGFVCAAMILSLWRRNRHRYPGLGFLVSVIIIQAVGTLLIALRGSVPDWLSIVVANCLVAGSLLVAYVGLERLATKGDQRLVRYVFLGGCVVFAAFVVVQAYYSYAEPRVDARILNTSSIQLLLSVQCIWLLTREVRPGRRGSMAIMAGVFGGYCLLHAARLIAAAAGAYGASDYMESGQVESVLLLLYLSLLILFAYSITLMVNEMLSTVVETQEEKFTKAFRSVPTAVLMTRVSTGEIVEVNDAFCSITGYGVDEAVGKTTVGLRLWAEQERTRFRDELLRGGRLRDKEYEFRRKSGDLFAGALSAEVISIDGEQMILSAVVRHSCSRRRRWRPWDNWQVASLTTSTTYLA